MKSSNIPPSERAKWLWDHVVGRVADFEPDHLEEVANEDERGTILSITMHLRFQTFGDATMARRLLFRDMRASLMISVPENVSGSESEHLISLPLYIHETRLLDGQIPVCAVKLRLIPSTKKDCPSLTFLPLAHKLQHEGAAQGWRRLVMVAVLCHKNHPSSAFPLTNPCYDPVSSGYDALPASGSPDAIRSAALPVLGEVEVPPHSFSPDWRPSDDEIGRVLEGLTRDTQDDRAFDDLWKPPSAFESGGGGDTPSSAR